MSRTVRPLAIATAALLIAVLAVAIAPGSTRDALAANIPTPWTVSVTPATNITDGRLISITISTVAENPVVEARAQVCRPGVTYRPNFASTPNADFAIGGPNCPALPISTSADLTATDTAVAQYATQPGGRTFEMFVGKGTVEWPLNTGDHPVQRLTCGVGSPCSLVVQVRGRDAAGDLRWIPFVQELTYLDEDPIAGCGGPADGIVTAAGSDRMIDAWIGWTLDQCRAPGAQRGAISSTSFAGEGPAMDSFSRGDVDLAFSAVGYDRAVGLGLGPRSEPLTPRASVAVPIGINAAVVAVGNGQLGANGNKIPYSPVRMSLDQAASMFAGGSDFFTGALLEGLTSANPELATTGVFAPRGVSAVLTGGPSETESTSWFLTRHFATLRPSLWKVPSAGVFGPEAGQSRSISASLALSSPSFQGALQLYSGRTLLDKAIKGLGRTDNFGGVWAITDLVTARALAMTPVTLENAAGQYVSPTAESMAAGIEAATTSAEGFRIPRPDATSANVPSMNGPMAATQPYPLTFVEYAIVPAEPLTNATCAPRVASQKLLTDWLNYLTGPGQENLPEGMIPLTPALRADATTAIAKVGTAASTCGQKPTGVAASGSIDPITAPLAVGSTRRPTVPAPTGPGAAGAVAGSGATDDSELISAIASMPSFSNSGSSGTRAMVGLIVVFGLLLLGALATSGRLGLRRRS